VAYYRATGGQSYIGVPIRGQRYTPENLRAVGRAGLIDYTLLRSRAFPLPSDASRHCALRSRMSNPEEATALRTQEAEASAVV
jgi:hypothetical protein